MTESSYDCVVIGGGPAGLSAALFLARYRHKVVVLHHNSPRNLYSHGIHGFLGHHGITPSELLAKGRDEVAAHGGDIIEACATRTRQLVNGSFEVATTINDLPGPTFQAPRLLLATGLRDTTPDCRGFKEFYGSTVFHCPDCDGFEVTGKKVAVLSHGKNAVGFTLDLLTWTNQLTLLTDGKELPYSDRAKLAAFNIPIREETIEGIEGDIGLREIARVCFANGDSLDCDALFFNLGTHPASNLHEMLGCRLEDDLVWVDETQQTSVTGVYAAGDLTPKSQLAVVAAAEGAMAAIHIHDSLVPKERRVIR